MNDEIKEILDRLSNIAPYAEVPKEFAYLTTNITPQECKLLLDYITNLQQEKQTLQENNQSMQEEMARVWEENERLKQTQYVWSYDLDMQLEDYKSRCEKAVEYINENVAVYAFNNKELPHWEFDDDNINDLLNILQNGSDSQ